MIARADEMCLSEPDVWLGPNREAVFTGLREHSPVSWQQEPGTRWSGAGRGYWAVVRHADVRLVSRTTETFASGFGTELFDLPLHVARAYSGMLDMDAPEHTVMRALVTDAFSLRRVRQLELDIRQHAREVIHAVSEDGSCNFGADIADALPTLVTCDLLGVPDADRAQVARLSRASVPLGDPEFGAPHESVNAARKLIEYGTDLIADRRSRPTDDLTSVLATAEIDGDRLDPEVAATFFELLVTAGIETTGAAISHGLLALSENPDQRELWRDDFDQVAPTAIDEILRWSTPVSHFRRTALTDTEIARQPIRAGSKVVLFYNSANRDETVFADPTRFDVTREVNPHMAFGGGGPHFCLGAHLARSEMRILFQELFDCLPDIEVADTPVLMQSMFLNGVKALSCTFTPRTRSTKR